MPDVPPSPVMTCEHEDGTDSSRRYPVCFGYSNGMKLSPVVPPRNLAEAIMHSGGPLCDSRSWRLHPEVVRGFPHSVEANYTIVPQLNQFILVNKR
jgi:hypothetical protein